MQRRSGTEINRKQFLRLTAATPAIAALPAAEAQQASARQPNVLIIMTDQHRRNYMTAAGESIVPTPNIDRIASRGVRFTSAVCPYPVCAASRASLLTGLHAHSTGVINNTDLLNWKTRTVAHHFADRGYHTGLIGKMHFNDGHHHGFEYFLGFNDWFMYLGPKVQGYADEIANHPIAPQFFNTVNDDGSGLPELPSVWGGKSPWVGHVKPIGLASVLPVEDQFDAFVARESCRFLERSAGEPFFLVASFLRPHPPLHPPEDWAAKYPLESMDLKPVGDETQYPKWVQRVIARYQGLGPERLKAHRSGYLGNLAYVDTCVGELYKTLERLNLDRNTVVIYTSDHGEMDGDHGLYQKFCLFDPSVGVPLIVSQPGTLPENKVCDAPVGYFGIYPTLAELTAGPAPKGIDAQSFASLVRRPDARGPEAVFSEYNLRSNNDCYMIRNRRYKYIVNRDDIAELYDLEADPGENRNLASDPKLSRTRKNLHDQLIAWYDPARNHFRPVAHS
jgi:choline-sulfatase